VIATWVGVRLIGDSVVRQVQDKVRIDLNAARVIYQETLIRVKDVVRLTTNRFFLKRGYSNQNISSLKDELNRIREYEFLDILTLTDENGTIIYSSNNPELRGTSQASDEIFKIAKRTQSVVASTELLSYEDLLQEARYLAESAYVPIVPTPMAMPGEDQELKLGMMIKVAAPVYDLQERLKGYLYAGILVNQNNVIVDKIKDTVYQGEVYKGKDMGAATIFLGDVRISTNVTHEDGSRAIGTRVSEEVHEQVLIRGTPWIERAFVVNDWYITAYEPIRNIKGDIIGMLSVAMLETKFRDLKRSTLFVFLSIAIGSIVVAFTVSYLLANKILRPVIELRNASERIAEGDFSFRVQPRTQDELGELTKTYNFMAESLRERDKKLREYTQKKIMESERLAIIGQLAAGVAHELNNPLGGILIYSHLLLESLSDEDPNRENLEKIVTQTTRCKKIIKGLLDFSRQTEPKMEIHDIEGLLTDALSLLESQPVFQSISIQNDFRARQSRVKVDRNQIEQVFINIIMNAAEAMDGEGELSIRTLISEEGQWIDIYFKDTGSGIAERDIEKLFEPFFTTKEVGEGTGLGLSISLGIVQRHGGTITVTSTVKKGTTFIVRLPVDKSEDL
jgi:two-component system NtrC family sensor kinase